MKPTTQRKLFPLTEPKTRGRFRFTHAMAMIMVATNGHPLGAPSHSLLGTFRWPTSSRTYRPNGEREKARRRRQIARGHIVPSKTYVDSIDYAGGGWDSKEYVT